MSDITAMQWNTVVVGKWNPAILTPKGIASEIFGKPPDEPVEVLVPLNAIGPVKVKIDGLIVSTDYDRLVIDCETSDWKTIDKARKYSCKAIDALPKTPLIASGFNIRYTLSNPDDHFTEILSVPLDTGLSDNGLSIVKREIRRSFAWNKGVINLHIVKEEADSYNIMMNFNKSSNHIEELKGWLNIPIDQVRGITKTVVCAILKICEEEEIA